MDQVVPGIVAALVSLPFWGFSHASSQFNYESFGAGHSQGNIQLRVQPSYWGTVWRDDNGEFAPFMDPITGDAIYGCVYPRESGHRFMDGHLVAGAIAGKDTVSSFFSFSPDNFFYNGSRWKVSTRDMSKPYYSPEARSMLDLECRFYDTAVWLNPWPTAIWDFNHFYPLEVVVKQRSMAWSGNLIDDFILIEYEITNVGREPLKNFYAGFWCKENVSELFPFTFNEDDLTGFLKTWPFVDQCDSLHPLNLAYLMDDDGDPANGSFNFHSRRGAVGVMLLGSTSDALVIGYNWICWTPDYSQDWGPRWRPTEDEPWRSFNPFYAWPGGDRNLYYLMSHPHIAYDQMFAAADHSGWMPPGALAAEFASGWPSFMYYSFGPFEIPVRDRVSFTIAVVGGDNVHNDPYAHFNPHFPQEYYDQLDFSELAQNARWAQWVYDNPGVDTDSDGYFGEFRVCEGDTTWYKGDGVPDFRGNCPPPIPFTRYETEPGRIIVRWNGFLSETTKDIFSGLVDFEGYRVYCGLDNRRTSLSLLSSYDKENWFRLKYHQLGVGNGRWINDDPPYSLDSLRTIHNDPVLNPDRYTRDRPLFEGDSAFYFAPVDANLADLSSATGIHKVYPDATNPGKDSLLWTESDITMEHGRKLPKYYEYEYIIENLLPTVPYFVSVTVFDFGYAGGRGNLPPDETNPLSNCTEVYAQTSSEVVEQENLDVIVYPNPYLADARYDERGYENRKGNIIPDRARLIHFSNLPSVCKISIFSLDGDLVGTINHNYPEGGPEAMHDWWNLVSRSGLAVESGLYYWVVESDTRTQMGKLVILK